MLGRVPVCAGVVHMHMDITAHPAHAWIFGRGDLLQLNSYIHCLAVFDLNLFLFEFVFETLHHADRRRSRGNLDRRITIALEVVGFEWPFVAIKAVVRLHPCISRAIRATVRSRDKNAGGCHVPAFIGHAEMDSPYWRQEVSLFRDQLLLLSPGYLLKP